MSTHTYPVHFDKLEHEASVHEREEVLEKISETFVDELSVGWVGSHRTQDFTGY